MKISTRPTDARGWALVLNAQEADAPYGKGRGYTLDWTDRRRPLQQLESASDCNSSSIEFLPSGPKRCWLQATVDVGEFATTSPR